MKIIDANVILRYLLNDVPRLSDKATKVIETEAIFIPVEVIAEVVYVLEKVYQVKRVELSKLLVQLIQFKNIEVAEQAVVVEALNNYGRISLDFVDLLLLAYNTIEGYEVETFDEKLKKQLIG